MVGATIMAIPYFHGVRPCRIGGKLSWTSFTSMEVRPFKLEELSWTSFPSKKYDPLGWWGSHQLSWTSFTFKGNDPLGWVVSNSRQKLHTDKVKRKYRVINILPTLEVRTVETCKTSRPQRKTIADVTTKLSSEICLKQ